MGQKEVDTLLVVRRPELIDCPSPPEGLLKWLVSGWHQLENEPEIIDTSDENNVDTIPELFEDDIFRVDQFDKWNEDRRKWKVTEEPARNTMKVFERLYSLYAQIEREQEQVELILGDGILDWRPSEGNRISHPVLLQKVNLHFNPTTPEFYVTPSDGGCSFYSALFRDVEEVLASTIKSCVDELESNPCGPMDQSLTDEYLTRVISQLSAKGKFIRFGESMDSSIKSEKSPYIVRNPVLFLRKRSLGFANALDQILGHIMESDVLPEAVTRITGIELNNTEEAKNEDFISLDVNGEDEDILFTKDANSEQLEIALKIQRYGSVLVQGPPGTGKTHTIANLLGHFLSEGKSVLVTSHTSKALSVLRDKVVKPMQDLCVSVINEDTGNQQMDQSIDIITEKLSSVNERYYIDSIRQLEHRRNELLDILRKTNRDLRMVREGEYTPIVFLGESYEPSKVARMLSEHEEYLCYIPGVINVRTALELTEEQIQLLYKSNELLTSEEEQELELISLESTQLMQPYDFRDLAVTYNIYLEKPRELHLNIWSTDDVKIEEIREVYNGALEIVGQLNKSELWKMEILTAGKNESVEIELWKEFITELESLVNQYQGAKAVSYRYELEISPTSFTQQSVQVVKEIIDYISSGGKLNKLQLILHPNWSRFVKTVQINGTSPNQLEHFEAIHTVLNHRLARSATLSRWNRQVTSIGGPNSEDLGNELELNIPRFISEINKLIFWHQKFYEDIQEKLSGCGLNWEKFINIRKPDNVVYSELLHIKSLIELELAGIIESLIDQQKLDDLHVEIHKLCEVVKNNCSVNSKCYSELPNVIFNRDAEKYESLYREIELLCSKNKLKQQRRDLLSSLEIIAPEWALAIKNREGIHGQSHVPFDVTKAWLMKQLETELNRRLSLNPSELQQQLLQARSEFRSITIKLVEMKAWLALKQKTTLTQQNALQGWKQLLKRVGKGTGIRAPRLLAEAKKLMPICQTAVPVWIMPISRVVDSFDPAKNQFDVVIIDEASQADIMALTALYLGKQVIVVGDDNQVSPEAVGQKLNEVQKLIDTQLIGIPNAALYDGMTSIYDLAMTSFAGISQLKEHFRCVEPIIQFSNQLSYKGSILPLRDASDVETQPFTIPYRVEGVNIGKTNIVEAKSIASLIIAATENSTYSDSTFGVISLVGDEQALLIDQYLHRYLSPNEYKRRNIRCGNSSQFQGDERDVIFLSMVHANDKEGPLSMMADPGERMKKRYNVAASRARNQMWLCYSLNELIDLKDGDLRKRLIQHVQNPMAVQELMKQAKPHIQSEFERRVMEILMNEGYKVIPQWKVGAYSIDMVVEGSGKRLAVECDGDRWHPIEKLGEDMARQAILERLGWRFVRIRGTAFFRNSDVAMRELLETLEKLSISRELYLSTTSTDDNNQIKMKVIRRAEELRLEWEEDYVSPFKPKGISNRSKRTFTRTGSGIVTEAFSLLDYLILNNLEFIDKRPKGGALWVIGGRSIEKKLTALKKEGYQFLFVQNGSNSTKGVPGWYLKEL